MRIEVKDQITVNAPATEAWRVLAHEFENIGLWSSGITESKAIANLPTPEGAKVGGRICLSDGFGGDVEEEFTYYDEEARRFGYKAVGELPSFITSAENNWSVRPLEANNSVVEFKAELELKLFLGVLLILLMPIVKKVWGTRTLEELKYYVEHDQPHPRKIRAQQKQKKVV